MTTIQGRAFQTEGNGFVPWSRLQTERVERMAEKNANDEPSTKHGIDAVRLCAFALPGPPLDRHSVVVLPLTVNNTSQHAEKVPIGAISYASKNRLRRVPWTSTFTNWWN